MSTLVTQLYLLEKYGPRSNVATRAVTWAAPSTPPHRRAKACAVAPKVLGPPPALSTPGPAAAAC